MVPLRESTDGATEGGTGVAWRWRTELTIVFLWIGHLLNVTCSVLNEQVYLVSLMACPVIFWGQHWGWGDHPKQLRTGGNWQQEADGSRSSKICTCLSQSVIFWGRSWGDHPKYSRPHEPPGRWSF